MSNAVVVSALNREGDAVLHLKKCYFNSKRNNSHSKLHFTWCLRHWYHMGYFFRRKTNQRRLTTNHIPESEYNH